MTSSAWKGLAVGMGIGTAVAAGAIVMRTSKQNADRAVLARAEAAEAALPGKVAAVDPTLPTITVYKTATCGCCKLWVSYLQENGYNVVAKDISDAELTTFTEGKGVPKQLESCHTAIVDGYVLEGHVPVADIKKLLAERPPIAGLALPGMVSGSPGMPGSSTAHYDIIAFDKKGATSVYSKN